MDGKSAIISALPVVLNVGSLESKEAHEPFFHRMVQDGLIVRPGIPVLEKCVNNYRGIQAPVL